MLKILLVSFLVSCSSLAPQSQKINPLTYYRHDLKFTYETGKETTEKIKSFFKRFKKGKYRKTQVVRETLSFYGTGVLPYLDKYKIVVKSPNNMNFFLMKSCHEEATTENPNKGIFKKNGKVTIMYEPTLEKGEACPLYLAAYSRKGKHATGLIVFEHLDYQLEATLHCNGYVTEHLGVSICAAREGLIQKLVFKEPVAIGDPVSGPADRTTKSPKCPMLPLTKDKRSTGLFKIPSRECIYPIIGLESLKVHQFYTVGYEDIVIRE